MWQKFMGRREKQIHTLSMRVNLPNMFCTEMVIKDVKIAWVLFLNSHFRVILVEYSKRKSLPPPP